MPPSLFLVGSAKSRFDAHYQNMRPNGDFTVVPTTSSKLHHLTFPVVGPTCQLFLGVSFVGRAGTGPQHMFATSGDEVRRFRRTLHEALLLCLTWPARFSVVL